MSHTGWVFTSFKTNFINNLPSRAVYLVFQLEQCPATGKQHWQGYIEMDSKCRMAAVKKAIDDNGAHLEPRMGSPAQARDYCMKVVSRVAGPWEFGTLPNANGVRNDFKEACAIVREEGYYALYEKGGYDHIIVQYSRGLRELHNLRMCKFRNIKRDVEVFVLFGPGGAGKTTWVEDHVKDLRTVYRLPPSNSTIPWFQDYDGQPNLWIEEMHPERINFEWLMQALEGGPLCCQTKGSSIWAGWSRVYITSNHHPSKWYNWNDKPQESLYRRIRVKGVMHFYADHSWKLEDPDILGPMSQAALGGNTTISSTPQVAGAPGVPPLVPRS